MYTWARASSGKRSVCADNASPGIAASKKTLQLQSEKEKLVILLRALQSFSTRFYFPSPDIIIISYMHIHSYMLDQIQASAIPSQMKRQTPLF